MCVIKLQQKETNLKETLETTCYGKFSSWLKLLLSYSTSWWRLSRMYVCMMYLYISIHDGYNKMKSDSRNGSEDIISNHCSIRETPIYVWTTTSHKRKKKCDQRILQTFLKLQQYMPWDKDIAFSSSFKLAVMLIMLI